MNIYQKHLNRKSNMSKEMYNFQNKLDGKQEVSFRQWRILTREIVKEANGILGNRQKALLYIRRIIRKEYNNYLNFKKLNGQIVKE